MIPTRHTARRALLIAGTFLLGSLSLPAQIPDNVALPENSVTRISDHVYAILGWPNIGIVVGSRATLVVDTGLGPRNGQVVAREAAKLAKGPLLYLTTTHFHPEHAAGEPGFPPSTILVRNSAQQEEMNRYGAQMIEMFGRDPARKPFLQDVKLRLPDIVFDRDLKLDLGGDVLVRLFWLGAGHTGGDELIYVEPDRTLISGDLVGNRITPSTTGKESSLKSWITVLDKVSRLNIKTVLPTHSAPGPAAPMLEQDRAFFSEFQARALALKRMGISPVDAATQMEAEVRMKYPDWQIGFGFASVVKNIYDENP